MSRRLTRRTIIRSSAAAAMALTRGAVPARGKLGANDRLRVGIIGPGDRGTSLLSDFFSHASPYNAELVAVYSVGGLTPGGAVDVLERREVLRSGVTILSTEDRYERPAATFTSAKPLRFSHDAAPGVYLLRVTLVAAGARVQGEASFEIR